MPLQVYSVCGSFLCKCKQITIREFARVVFDSLVDPLGLLLYDGSAAADLEADVVSAETIEHLWLFCRGCLHFAQIVISLW